MRPSFRQMSRLLPLCVLLPCGAAAPALGQSPPAPLRVGVELVLAVDVSRSVDAAERTIQRHGYAEAFRSAQVQEAIAESGWGRAAVTYVEWAGAESQRVVIPWTLVDGPAAADAFADRIEAAAMTGASRTSISGAIAFSTGLFGQGGFAGMRRVIDVSGDGPNNEGGPVTAARDAAVARGITINGLPLMTNLPGDGIGSWGVIPHLDLYYAGCVIGGSGAFILPVTGWNQFAAAVRRKMVLELSGVAPGQGARVIRVQARGAPAADGAGPAAVDCGIGERMWQERWKRWQGGD